MKDAVLLPTERKRVLDAMQEEISSEIENGSDPLECSSRLYQDLLDIGDEKPPYIGILLWWLKDFMEKCTANT